MHKVMLRGVCAGLAFLGIVSLAGCGGEADNTPSAGKEGGTSAPDVSNASPDKGAGASSSNKPDAKSLAAKNPAIQGHDTGGRTRVLDDPDDDTMGWIYLDWAGIEPDLGEVAERNVGRPGHKYRGQVINEFNRQEFVEAEQERLELLSKSTRGYGYVTVNIRGQLGGYDPEYGEFYIGSFSPGSSVTLGSAFHTTAYSGGTGLDSFLVSMKMKNALDAYIWKATPEEAQKIIGVMEREGATQFRGIYARTRLKILNATLGYGKTREMEGEIQSFTLFTQKGTPLLERTLVK